jgi:hypothetical protein
MFVTDLVSLLQQGSSLIKKHSKAFATMWPQMCVPPQSSYDHLFFTDAIDAPRWLSREKSICRCVLGEHGLPLFLTSSIPREQDHAVTRLVSGKPEEIQ